MLIPQKRLFFFQTIQGEPYNLGVCPQNIILSKLKN